MRQHYPVLGESGNQELRNFLTHKHISLSALAESGASWDPEKKALAYPRISRDGELVGFKYRPILGGKPWAEPSGISGKDLLPWCVQLNGHPSLVVFTEGETDALCLASYFGLNSSVIYAIPGSSGWNHWWSELCIGKDVLVIPDADTAGDKLARSIARDVPRVRVARLPRGYDVCSAIREQGIDFVGEAMQDASMLSVKEIPSRSYKSEGIHILDPQIFSSGLLSEISSTVELRRRGSEWAARCPFHAERTPSFMVNESKGVWFCHGCERGGTLVDFVITRDGLSYGQAVDYLSNKFGISVGVSR
jgi:5S rRNA maturation endonuclease (ribonuclease M5)